MSMLDRYRKPGGFLQLLALMETTGPSKQEKFFEIIRAEDPRWADALKAKMIDMQKIFSWKDEVLAEIVGRSHDLTLATILSIGSPEQRQRVAKLIGHSRWRKIEELISTSAPPQPQEIATMQMKTIETVRAMIKEGALRLDKIDGSLVIEEKIEEKLGKSSSHESRESHPAPDTTSDFGNVTATPHAHDAATVPGVSESERGELVVLRRKFSELSKENASLRQEVSNLRNKLEQIRRIA